jgi:hypothetical protein
MDTSIIAIVCLGLMTWGMCSLLVALWNFCAWIAKCK